MWVTNKSIVKFFTFLLLFFCNQNFAIALPDLGNVDNLAVNKSDEDILSRVLIQDLYFHNAINQDILINEYVSDVVGKRLAFYAPKRKQKYNFFVINNDEVNAFAFFGGNVGIYNGVLLTVDTESELAAIMAHEVAHISQNHLNRHLASNKRLLPITMIEAIAAVAVGVPDLAIAAIAAHQQQLINFTREFEEEADRIGIRILYEAGFSPEAMPNVFYKMQKAERYTSRPPEYLVTHPMFENRISDARNRASIYPYKQYISSLDFYLVKSRIRVLSAKDLDKHVAILEKQVKERKYFNEIAARYELALAYFKNGKFNKALKMAKNLVNKDEQNIFINLLLANIYEKLGRINEAIAVLNSLQESHPNNQAVMLQYANFQLNNNKLKKALRILLDYNKEYKSLKGYELLVKVESLLKNHVNAHIYRAKWFVLKGDLERALYQLDVALEYANKNVSAQNKIRFMQNKIKNMLEEQESI